MTNQELIQEAAVIRDERNQYANTAERVGTALVHMAEQLAAQAADVDNIEKDVRGALTLAQLDNPLGFTTPAQWGLGLRGEQSYTFRLVAASGRCIGHVWLFNDADHYNNSSQSARVLEMVMCCATINAATGALTYDAINGSPRIYYRSYIAAATGGGTPDGGNPGLFKWSAWQEYRDYGSKPIKDALAALQQQHTTDVADLQASINATLAASNRTMSLHYKLQGQNKTIVNVDFDAIPGHSYTLVVSHKYSVSNEAISGAAFVFRFGYWSEASHITFNSIFSLNKNNYEDDMKLFISGVIQTAFGHFEFRANEDEEVDFYLIDNTSESILTTHDVKKISDDHYFDLKKKVGMDSVVLNGVSNTWITADGYLHTHNNYRTTKAKNDGYKKVIVHSQCGDNNLTEGMVPVAFYNGEPSTSTFMQSASAAPLYNRNTPTWYEMDIPEDAQYICACSRNGYTDVKMYLLEHSIFDKMVRDFMEVGLTKTEQNLTYAEKNQSRKNIGIDNKFLNAEYCIDGVAVYGYEVGYIDAGGNKKTYGTYSRSLIPNKGYSSIEVLCGSKGAIYGPGITFVAFYNGEPSANTFMPAESMPPIYTDTNWEWRKINVPESAKYIGVCSRNNASYPLKGLLKVEPLLKDFKTGIRDIETEIEKEIYSYESIKNNVGMMGIDNKRAGMAFTSSTFTESKFPFAKREVTGKRVGIKPAVYLGTPYYMQGAAIYENILFITCGGNYGNVTFVDMRNGEVIQFTPGLIKTDKEHHNNQAFFGTEKYDENDYFPLLYISGASDNIGCIEVYRITGEYGNWTMNVVQTIGLPLDNPEYDITTAEISMNGGNMIALGYKSSTYSSTETENTTRVADLGELPPLSAGNTVITTVVDAWDLANNLPYYQGNIILNNMLYIGFGRKLAVIDLINKTEEIIQLYNFEMEQEAYFLYNNALYVAGIGGNSTYGVKVPIVYYIEFIKE